MKTKIEEKESIQQKARRVDVPSDQQHLESHLLKLASDGDWVSLARSLDLLPEKNFAELDWNTRPQDEKVPGCGVTLAWQIAALANRGHPEFLEKLLDLPLEVLKKLDWNANSRSKSSLLKITLYSITAGLVNCIYIKNILKSVLNSLLWTEAVKAQFCELFNK